MNDPQKALEPPKWRLSRFHPHKHCWVPGHTFGNDWDIAQKHTECQDGTRLFPVRVTARYWISAAVPRGVVHIATGRGTREVTRGGYQSVTVEPHCPGHVDYPRPIDSPDAAPGFVLCVRCVERASQ